MALAQDGAVATALDDRRYYKYMSRATARIVLENRTLRWSTPEMLNDPFDNQFDLHVDINLDRARDLCVAKLWGAYVGIYHAGGAAGEVLNRLRQAQPRLSRAVFEENILPALEGGLARLDDHARTMNEALRPARAQHKVLCLALTGTDIPMWSYYAENHRGVVLCFRSRADSPWEAGRAVEYLNEMPRLLDEEALSDLISGRAGMDPMVIMRKSVFTKAKAWAHEQEWRIFTGVGRTAEAPFEDILFGVDELDGVIFGCLTPQRDRDALADLVRRRYPQAQLLEAARHDRKFELVTRAMAQVD